MKRSGEKFLFALFLLFIPMPFLSLADLEPSGIFLFLTVFVGIFITLNLFLFNKDDVSLGERYTYGIVSVVSHIIQRETVNDHREIFNSYREKATNGESWLQVINAYLNRTVRSSINT